MRRIILQCFVLAWIGGSMLSVVAAKNHQPSVASSLAKLGRGVDEVALLDETGKAVRWGTLNGKRRAVFFGFTRCPVICPVTVWQLEAALLSLGDKAKKIEVEFVSLDPERDTPEVLKTFFSGFKIGVRGLTGTAESVNRVAAAFEVVHERVALKGDDYTLDHTAAVFLLDERGVVVETLAYGTPVDVVEKRLSALIDAAPAKK